MTVLDGISFRFFFINFTMEVDYNEKIRLCSCPSTLSNGRSG